MLSDKSKYKELKKILGFYPDNAALYDQAFTHKSIVNEERLGEKDSNERLEFLGDAVLGAVIADYLYLQYPQEDEGFLSKMRSKMVNRAFLNQLAIDLGLDTFIETSADTSRSQSIFGDAFEALIGAIYLDKGYNECKTFIIDRVVKDYIDLKQLINTESNYKSKLIEWTQQHKLPYEFKITFQEADQAKEFLCQLYVSGELVGKFFCLIGFLKSI